ncbi:hypothetical protein Gohar_021613 [Gossypium harknessii]|uniref:Knottins-like domain-containing protein n=1 Tax=Gossypium harknessii TaxID=34285 RepID=A0A7J9I8P6_9ROSI|nr:hypothetical protein [Gossypium harknessii]
MGHVAVEGGPICKATSNVYKGLCLIDDSCDIVCKREGFHRGNCKGLLHANEAEGCVLEPEARKPEINVFQILSFGQLMTQQKTILKKPVPIAQRTSHGSLHIKWIFFDPLELAQFKEQVMKPIYVMPWWPSEAIMGN